MVHCQVNGWLLLLGLHLGPSLALSPQHGQLFLWKGRLVALIVFNTQNRINSEIFASENQNDSIVKDTENHSLVVSNLHPPEY